MVLFWIIIAGVLVGIYLVAWALAIAANKIYPKFSRKRYLLLLFSAPFVIEFMQILAAFIVPDFGWTINLKSIYRQAQFTSGFPRSEVEVRAAALAQKTILRHYPIGSHSKPLVEYLTKSGMTCKEVEFPINPQLYSTCSYQHWHPEGIGIIHWSIDIESTDSINTNKVNVSTYDETN